MSWRLRSRAGYHTPRQAAATPPCTRVQVWAQSSAPICGPVPTACLPRAAAALQPAPLTRSHSLDAQGRPGVAALLSHQLVETCREVGCTAQHSGEGECADACRGPGRPHSPKSHSLALRQPSGLLASRIFSAFRSRWMTMGLTAARKVCGRPVMRHARAGAACRLSRTPHSHVRTRVQVGQRLCHPQRPSHSLQQRIPAAGQPRVDWPVAQG